MTEFTKSQNISSMPSLETWVKQLNGTLDVQEVARTKPKPIEEISDKPYYLLRNDVDNGSIKDIKTISTGSYTIGTGGSYATWQAGCADLTDLTGCSAVFSIVFSAFFLSSSSCSLLTSCSFSHFSFCKFTIFFHFPLNGRNQRH